MSELAASLAGAYGIEKQRALAGCAALRADLQSHGLLEGSRRKSTANFLNPVWWPQRLNGWQTRYGRRP
jgi:hypothetical protein